MTRAKDSAAKRNPRLGRPAGGKTGLAFEKSDGNHAPGECAMGKDFLARAERLLRFGSWEWDVLTNRLCWSDGLRRVLGLPGGGNTGTYATLLDTIHPADRQFFDESVQGFLLEGSTFDMDHRVVLPGGSEGTVQENIEIQRDHEGRAVRVTGMVLDLGERRRLEESIRKHKDFLNETLESLSYPFYVLDVHNHKIKMANAAARALSPPGDSVGRTIRETTCHQLTHGSATPCRGPDHPCPIEEGMREKRPVRVEHIHMDASGNPRYFEVHAHPVLDAQGNLAQMIEYAVDVTDRKNAEEALKFSEEYARNILDSAPVGIVIIDQETHRILDINRTGVQMVGLPKDAIQGRTCHEVICASEHGQCPITDLNRQIDNAECLLVNGRGRLVPILKTVIASEFQGRKCLVEVFVDITERKEMEDELRQRDDRLAEAEKFAKFGSWDWDIENAAFRFSGGFCRILGLDDRAFGGTIQSFLELVHPKDRALVNQNIENAIIAGKPFDIDHRVLLPDGTERVIQSQAGCTFDGNGNAVRMFGIVQDVTERRQREDGYQKQNEFLKSVIESLTHPFYVIDAKDYSIVYANSALSAMDGEWRHSTCYALTHKSEQPCRGEEHMCPLEEVRRTKRPVVTEHVHYDKDGGVRYFEVHGYPILDNEGNLLQMIEYSLDITQRKKTEAALRQSEEEFRTLSQEFNALLDAIPDTILLISPELKILWANKGAVTALAKDMESVTGQYCHRLWGNETPCKNCPALVSFRTGRMETVQVSSKDGRFWDLRAFPIMSEDGAVSKVIEVASDITEKVTLQTEAMRAGHLASLGELAAGVAHEINNPINSIINFAQILIDTGEESEGLAREIPGRIIKEGDRIAGIVRSLLSFARESEKKKGPVHAGKIMAEALTLTETQIRKEGIQLKVEIPDALPRIFGHFQQIQQVFLNIINNSRYALNKRFPVRDPAKILRIEGREEIVEGRKFVKIVFYDQGTGIPADILDKVINPFFSTKPADRGTGLGLTISHGIIADHGGRLFIESEEGEFTRVTVLLPEAVETETGTNGLQ